MHRSCKLRDFTMDILYITILIKNLPHHKALNIRKHLKTLTIFTKTY